MNPLDIVLGLGHARRPRKIPRSRPPTAIEREYARELEAFVDLVERLLAPLLEMLPSLVQSAELDRRMDAGEGKKVQELVEQAAARLREAMALGKLEQLAAKFAARTSTYQRIQLNRQLEAAVGVDVFSGDRGAVLRI